MSTDQRIKALQAMRKAYPHTYQDNIDAIIEYYKKGGKMPTTDKLVYALDGQVFRGTKVQLGSDVQKAKKTPWVEMSCHQLGFLSKDSGSRDKKDKEHEQKREKVSKTMCSRKVCKVQSDGF